MKRFTILFAVCFALLFAAEASACHGSRNFAFSAPSCSPHFAPQQEFFFQSGRGRPQSLQLQVNPGDKIRFRQGPFGGTSLRIN